MASNWFQDLQEKRKTVLGTDSYVFLGKFIDQFGQLPTTMGVSLPIQAPLIDIIERRAEGHFYARHGTPATKELERRIKLLEAGDTDYFDSVAFPSGMAAIANTVEALTRSQSGNTFICGSDLYVHVRQLFERHLPPGFKAVFVDTTNPENVERALEQGGVIAVYFEPLSNPELQYTSTSNIADIAARAGVPVVVDNTFLSPALFQPLRHGAAIVIHSATKYLNGEGDLMAGVVTGPSSFINQDYGPRHLRTVKGAVLDDSRALTLAERLTNLPLRMQDHSVNAALLAKALREHSNVRHVHYPRLIDTYNELIFSSLLKLKYDGKIKVVSESKIKRAEELSLLKRSFKKYLDLYFLLNKIRVSDFERREEYRKNVTLISNLAKNKSLEVTVPVITEYFKKTKEFLEMIEVFIE